LIVIVTSLLGLSIILTPLATQFVTGAQSIAATCCKSLIFLILGSQKESTTCHEEKENA